MKFNPSLINRLNIRKTDIVVADSDKSNAHRIDIPPNKKFEEYISNKIKNGKIIGIYSQYFRSPSYKSRGNADCGYICIDIDLHGTCTPDNKSSIRKRINILKSRAKDYFFLSPEYIKIEETRNGFHIWIFFEQKIRQKYILRYIELIRNNIKVFFSEYEILSEIAFYPKSEIGKDGYGNAVFLHSISDNRDTSRVEMVGKSRIIEILEEAKRSSEYWENKNSGSSANNYKWEKNGNNFQNFRKLRINNIINFERFETFSHSFPTVLLKKYGECIASRQCIINCITGKYDLQGNFGNTMRVRMVQELNALGFPEEEIIAAFSNLTDFEYQKARYHVRKCIEKGYPEPRCESIKKCGFCDPEKCCYAGSTSFRSTKYYNNGNEERDYPVLGWNERVDPNKPTLFEVLSEIISDEESYFINKTTRSGTTTATIIEALNQKKKMLMIAPTKDIFEKTVREAIDIGNEEHFGFENDFFRIVPKLFKITDNVELCERVEWNSVEMDSVFPFLLKPKCGKCNFTSCDFRKFKENMDDFSLVFMTTQKFKILMDIAKDSEEARNLLDDLFEWSDLIFIDECYHLFQINFTEITLKDKYTNRLNRIKELIIKYYKKLNNEFLRDLKKFIKKLEQIMKELPPKKSTFREIEKNWFDVFFLNSKDWAKQYGAFINLFKDIGDDDIKYLVEIFLALSCKEVYIQQRINFKGESIISLASVSDIKNFIYKLGKIKEKLILTDAVKPPIKLKKVFPNIKEKNINDPMRTAEKQTVYVKSKSDPFYTFGKTKYYTASQKEKLKKQIKRLGIDEPVFIVSQSVDYKKRFNTIVLPEIEIEENTYHRGKETIGVASDLRHMICIGSSHTPRHVYDIPAFIYQEIGLFPEDIDYKILGRYLENFNAMSTFFQSISRVKDPMGEEESFVYVFGMDNAEVERWFKELKISVPRLRK